MDKTSPLCLSLLAPVQIPLLNLVSNFDVHLAYIERSKASNCTNSSFPLSLLVFRVSITDDVHSILSPDWFATLTQSLDARAGLHATGPLRHTGLAMLTSMSGRLSRPGKFD